MLTTREVIGSSGSPVTLTNAYTGTGQRSAWIDIRNADQAAIDVWYTMGATETSNSIQVLIEFANPVSNSVDYSSLSTNATTGDNVRNASISTTSGTTTLTQQEYTFSAVSAAATYDSFQIQIPLMSKFMRIGVKETGIATNGGGARVRLTVREEECT